jgi:hypothetical protein
MAGMARSAPASPLGVGAAGLRLANVRLTWPRLTILGAIGFVVASVMRFPRPNFALEPIYTDHLQHEYSAWAFLHIGLRIFDTPKYDWGPVDATHVHLLWEQLPSIYPPGLIAFFMPFGVASNEGILPDERVHMLMVMVLGAGAVLASAQLVRTVRLHYDRSLAVVVAFLGTVVFLRVGLDGFIDATAAGLVLAGIYWAERGPPGRALIALVLALSLHYRLWYLWPFVLAFALRHRRELARWQLAVAAAVAAASGITFGLSVPFVAKFHQIPHITPNPLVLSHGIHAPQAAALAAGCLLLALALRYEGAAVAGCVALALVLVFAVDQWEPWYPALFVPLFALLRGRAAQVASTLAFVEGTLYLGGFPDVLRLVHVYAAAVG